MVRKIGNRLLIVLLSFFFVAIGAQSQKISLSLVDGSGAQLTEVAAGSTVVVKLTIADAQAQVRTPVVPGIEQFTNFGVQTSRTTTVMNGQHSTLSTYRYQIRVNAPGQYTIGPVQLPIDGVVHSSNLLTFKVGDQKKVVNGTAHGVAPAKVQLLVQKKSVYVGEPLVVTFRFTYEMGIQLATQPEVNFAAQGFEVGSQSKPFTSQQTIDGKSYIVEEQQIELFAHKPGNYTVPVVTVSCLIPRQRATRQSHFFDIDDFFGRSMEPYQVQSDPIPLTVMSLPTSEKEVSGVGEFKNFTAALESSSAREGEGVVLRLSVEGTGDAQKVGYPTLQLPESLYHYESKNEIEPTASNGFWKKKFEYIIQGSAQGTYEIKAQEFTYFDLKTKRYKTLKTEPLRLTIRAGTKKQRPNFGVDDKGATVAQVVKQDQAESESEPASSSRGFVIWMPLFIGICVGLILLLIAIELWRMMVRYRYNNAASIARRTAFKRARAALRTLKKEQDLYKLQMVIIQLFADYFSVAPSMVTESFIKNSLRNEKVDPQVIEQVIDFIAKLQEKVFYAAGSHGVENESFFDTADVLIITLEKQL